MGNVQEKEFLLTSPNNIKSIKHEINKSGLQKAFPDTKTTLGSCQLESKERTETDRKKPE